MDFSLNTLTGLDPSVEVVLQLWDPKGEIQTLFGKLKQNNF